MSIIKNTRKALARKKYIKVITPIIMMIFILSSIFIIKGSFAAVRYQLITDNNGITWQVSTYDNSNNISVSLYSAPDNITEIKVPSISEFKTLSNTIPNNITSVGISSYYYSSSIGTTAPDFNSKITKLDLSNCSYVDGINPILNPNIETQVILNPTETSYIGTDVFRNKKIDIKNLDKVKGIGGGAFYNTKFKNTKITFDVDYVYSGAFQNSNIVEVEYNVRESGASRYSLFRNCISLVSVKFGDNIYTIWDAEFEGCINLEYVDFNNVVEIKNNAFRYCTSFNQDLKDTNIKSMGTGVFWGTTGFTKPISMPNGVEKINWRAFHGSNIKSLDLNNVKTIDPEAFSECAELTNINFGNTISIGVKSFYHDKKLTNLIMSDSVLNISPYAFEDCSLESIDLANVKNVDYRAFARNNFNEVTLSNKIVSMNSMVFDGNNIEKLTITFDTTNGGISPIFMFLGNAYTKVKTIEFIAPYEDGDTLSTSRSYNSWTGGGCNYDSNDTATSYGNAMSYRNVLRSAFLFNLPCLEEVILGEGYEFIGANQTVDKNTSLKRVQLPSTLKGIGSYAFTHTFLEDNESDMKLPDSIEYIGSFAFENSFNFKEEVDIKNLKYIGSHAFDHSGITKIVFNDKLTTIGGVAIYHCKNLKTIIIDCDYFSLTSPTQIYNLFGNDYTTGFLHNFYDLIKFTDKVVTSPNIDSFFWGVQADTIDLEDAKLTSLGTNAFQMAKINTLKLPKTLLTIDSLAFFKTFITNPISLPSNLNRIETKAFLSAGVQAENDLPNTLTYIGFQAFYDCQFKDDIVVPGGVTFIGNLAFAAYGTSGGQQELYQGGSYVPTEGNVIHRNSITFLNSLSYSICSQPLFVVLMNTITDEITFGNRVTTLPTSKMNEGKTYEGSTPEFCSYNVKKVKFKNLKELPNKAFMYCYNLEEIDFSSDSSLTTIGAYAFMYTRSLKKIKLSSGSNLTINKLAFYSSGFESIGSADSGFDLENNTITLTDYGTFQDNVYLRKLELNSNFNNGVIPAATFEYNANLATVILHEDITKIEPRAFYSPIGSGSSGPSLIDPYGAQFWSYEYSYDNNFAIVMYGNTVIEEEPAVQTVTMQANDAPTISYQAWGYFGEGTVTVYDSYSGVTSTFENKHFTYTKASLSSVVTFTYSGNPDVRLSQNVYTYTSPVRATVSSYNKNNLTIGNSSIYCYSDNQNCNDYYETYNKSITSYIGSDYSKMNLYYLDEIVHIDSNKKNVDMLPDNSDIDKDGLEFYALRRDGVILKADENGNYTGAVKYADGDIDLLSYHPTLQDPERRVFNTSRDISDLHVEDSENFENLTYKIGEENTETGRIYVVVDYPNKVGTNSIASNVLKTKGNYADIVYSDGCNGESFGTIIYNDILVGESTPLFEGYELIRDGYEFLGWDKEISDTTTGDIVYVAQWKKIEDPIIPDDPNDPKPNGIINPKTGINLFLILLPLIVLFVGSIYIVNKKVKRVLQY